jgi:hypothetical protein
VDEILERMPDQERAEIYAAAYERVRRNLEGDQWNEQIAQLQTLWVNQPPTDS